MTAIGVVDFLRRCKERREMDEINTTEIRTWVDPPAQTAVVTDTHGRVVIRESPEGDPVNSPDHYCKEGFELGEVLYVWGVPHRRASAVEYIMRAGEKDPAKEVEDLRKAIRCLEMELSYMEKYGRRS